MQVKPRKKDTHHRHLQKHYENNQETAQKKLFHHPPSQRHQKQTHADRGKVPGDGLLEEMSPCY